MKTKSVNNPEFLLAAFSAADENIRYCKSQQWQITVYALTLHSALFLAPATLSLSSAIWNVPAALLSTTITAAATFLILRLHRDIEKYSQRQKSIENILQQAPILSANNPGKGSPLLFLFFYSLCASWVIAIWYFLSPRALGPLFLALLFAPPLAGTLAIKVNPMEFDTISKEIKRWSVGRAIIVGVFALLLVQSVSSGGTASGGLFRFGILAGVLLEIIEICLNHLQASSGNKSIVFSLVAGTSLIMLVVLLLDAVFFFV